MASVGLKNEWNKFWVHFVASIACLDILKIGVQLQLPLGTATVLYTLIDMSSVMQKQNELGIFTLYNSDFEGTWRFYELDYGDICIQIILGKSWYAELC
jgi:hypothetical protein